MNYQPLPNGYKICDECGLSVHKVGYKYCFQCLGKINPELYEKHARNFRPSVNHENISLRQDRGETDGPVTGDKPAPLSPAPEPIDYD